LAEFSFLLNFKPITTLDTSDKPIDVIVTLNGALSNWAYICFYSLRDLLSLYNKTHAI